MIPKIEFEYSSVYDEHWKKYLEIYYKAYKDPKTKIIIDHYPTKEKIMNYIKKIKPLWKKEERKILNKISELTKLEWKEEKIKVYMVGKCVPYSDPLTMTFYKNNNDFIDVLTHELIHQIQSQNSKTYHKWALYVEKRYKKESPLTRRHILLHAVHKELYLKLLGKSRLNRNLKKSVKKSYKRAWEIVENEGYENIIKKFREVTK